MKRFMLFSGDDYYPWGGMEDFKKSFDSLELAMEYKENKEDEDCIDWKHIFDIKENKIVKEYNRKKWETPQQF